MPRESEPTPRPRPAERPSRGWLAVALLGLIILAYARALGGGFLWDDDLHVSANPVIVGPLGLTEIWTTTAANYFPLVLTNFWVQHALWALNPVGYHVVTLGFHAAAALLLWRVLGKLGVDGAWLGATLWALHPVQVESVAWICELKNTQSAVFFLLAVGFWIEWLRRDSVGGTVSGNRNYGWMLVCALCALLSKPSTVMLPVVLILVSWWEHRRRPSVREIMALLPAFALSAAVGGWTIWEQKFHSGAVGIEWSRTFIERVLIAGRAIGFYLGKLIWPADLSFIYPRWSVSADSVADLVPPALALAVGGWLALRRASLAPAFFAGAFLVALLFPVLGFFDVYFFRYSYVGDHFQYLASMGPLALLGALLARVFPRRAAIPAGAALIMAFLALSVLQSADYRSPEALWKATVRRNPASAMAWTQLGSVYKDAGRHPDAIACFERALQLNPGHPEARNHLGIEHLLAGRNPEAIREFERALQARADFTEARMNLGRALLQEGHPAEALAALEAVARQRPQAYEPRYHIGNALVWLGRLPEGVQAYEVALALPHAADNGEVHHQYANALCRVGRLSEALRRYEHALRLEPERAQTHDDYGLALAAAGRPDEAAAEHQRALSFDPRLASAHNSLGVLFAKSGRIVEALGHFDAAVQYEPAYPNAQLNRGMALMALQRMDEASDVFARLVRQQPDSARAHAYYGQVLRALGREAEAQAHFQTAARLEEPRPTMAR